MSAGVDPERAGSSVEILIALYGLQGKTLPIS
jgi:hypothetical protein